MYFDISVFVISRVDYLPGRNTTYIIEVHINYYTCRIIIKILVYHDLSILCQSCLRLLRIGRLVALLHLWRNKVVIFGGKREAEKIKLFCSFMPELNIF